jgi:general L-amino acid transport system substrate-binding protein
LERVRARGNVICGISQEQPGISAPDEENGFAGLAVDYCRAVAAAVLNNPDAVRFEVVSGQRLAAGLLNGRIDMLAASEPVTTTSQAGAALAFGPPIFYDGPVVVVRPITGIETMVGLSRSSICVERDSPTEQALIAAFQAQGRRLTTVVFAQIDDALAAYDEGLCDAFSAPRGEIGGLLPLLSDPSQHVALDVTFADTPLAPATLASEREWSATVQAVIASTIVAAELGLDAATLEQQPDQAAAVARRVQRGLGAAVVEQLPNDFVTRTLRAVGNYNEIYARHFGDAAVVPLPPGPNTTVADGGLIGE